MTCEGLMLVAGSDSVCPSLQLLPGISPRVTLGVRRTRAWTGVTSCQGAAGSVGAAAASRDGLMLSAAELGAGRCRLRLQGLSQGCWPCQSERQDKEAVLHLVALAEGVQAGLQQHPAPFSTCFQMYLHSTTSYLLKK